MVARQDLDLFQTICKGAQQRLKSKNDLAAGMTGLICIYKSFYTNCNITHRHQYL